MSIGEVLSRAWHIIWKHKILWIFGILAGLGSAGNSGSANTGFRFSSSDRFNWSPAIQNFFERLQRWEIISLSIGLICLILILVLLVIVLGTVGRIGLIRGAQQADSGAEKLSFGELLGHSWRYFWRVLGLNLLVLIAALILVPLIGIPFTILTCGIGALVMIAALILLSIVVQQSIIAIIVENLDILEGLKRGWQVVKGHLGDMVVLWLILTVGIGVIILIIIGIPLVLLLTPLLFVSAANTGRVLDSGAIIYILCLVGFAPILILLSGLIRSFTESAWTLAFLRLTTSLPTVPPITPPVPPEELPNPL